MTISDYASQEQLSQAANRLTQLLEGKEIEAVRSVRAQVSGLDLELLDWVITEMNEATASGRPRSVPGWAGQCAGPTRIHRLGRGPPGLCMFWKNVRY